MVQPGTDSRGAPVCLARLPSDRCHPGRRPIPGPVGYGSRGSDPGAALRGWASGLYVRLSEASAEGRLGRLEPQAQSAVVRRQS